MVHSLDLLNMLTNQLHINPLYYTSLLQIFPLDTKRWLPSLRLSIEFRSQPSDTQELSSFAAYCSLKTVIENHIPLIIGTATAPEPFLVERSRRMLFGI